MTTKPSKTPYYRQLLTCITTGQCRDSWRLQAFNSNEQNSNSTPNALENKSALPLKLANNHEVVKPCEPCRFVGASLFLGISAYCGVVATQAVRKSGDFRLSATMSIAFGILGELVYFMRRFHSIEFVCLQVWPEHLKGDPTKSERRRVTIWLERADPPP